MSSPAKLTQVIASAPGKVILHGEYAVVFGKRAIAVSVDLRTTTHVVIGGEEVTLSLKNFSSEHSWTLQSLMSTSFTGPVGNRPPELQLDIVTQLVPSVSDPSVEQAIKAFLYLYLALSRKSDKWLALVVRVDSQFPAGAGLGSSAAFSVSLTAALTKAITGQDPAYQMISDWAFKCEHIFHGKPSGIDNSICTFGGAILFQSGKVVEVLHDMQRLPAILVYTNVTRNTKHLVESVTLRRERFPSILSCFMNAIDEISGESWQLMKNGKYAGSDLNELVAMNQQLLNGLGAGHESIEKVLAIAKAHGHVGKLTGAGGGGMVVIYVPQDLPQQRLDYLKTELEANNLPHWALSFGGAGVAFQSE